MVGFVADGNIHGQVDQLQAGMVTLEVNMLVDGAYFKSEIGVKSQDKKVIRTHADFLGILDDMEGNANSADHVLATRLLVEAVHDYRKASSSSCLRLYPDRKLAWLSAGTQENLCAEFLKRLDV
jgi:hypothetical protein